ncbi:hypothetical protein BC835DRAFT_678628 [Cytidiella melzeri]|nr:hypothetical protein BC835DRAFT_678628 [Cytidiella melzeri]
MRCAWFFSRLTPSSDSPRTSLSIYPSADPSVSDVLAYTFPPMEIPPFFISDQGCQPSDSFKTKDSQSKNPWDRPSGYAIDTDVLTRDASRSMH